MSTPCNLKLYGSTLLHIGLRNTFCRRILAVPEEDTEEFAYVDGTAYYLLLPETLSEHQMRLRWGAFV